MDEAQIELVAKVIYEQWHDQQGYKPWMDGGNSHKQYDARRIAVGLLKSLAAAPTPQAEEPRKLVQEWARTHYVRFVNRSSGLYSTDTVGLEGLCALVEMARATPPKENSNG